MNIDAKLRYAPIVKRLNNKNLKEPILEIGSGTNGISDYYKGKVYGVDSDFSKTTSAKNPNIKHFKGNILKIPFNNSEFGVIVCLDTFEHLKKNERLTALIELLRVLKKDGQLYLGFPTGSMVPIFEKLINYLFKKKYKREHPWLKEHIENGLPKKREIDQFLRNQNINDLKQIKNVNLFMWLLIHLIFTVYAGTKITHFLKKFSYFFYLLGLINLPPVYRVIYIIRK